MTLAVAALLIGGLLLLVAGAELFVRGASRLAAALGISPLVIGLTVVAFGTSSPEIAVSVQSAAAGAGELALGNVVGSNICNVLLILGLSATIAPLVVSQQLVRLDVPVMIAASVLLLLLALDGMIGRPEAIFLLLAALGYTAFLLVQSRRGSSAVEAGTGRDEAPATRGGRVANFLLVGAGVGLLVIGSRWLVGGATEIAVAAGVSQLVIGLTVVAIGTSLPEIATSVIAMVRGERDIAVGNAVGSNIFNILLVLGLAGLAAPLGLPVPDAALRFDLPVMIATALACLPIFFTGNRIDRWEGLLFLGYYGAYLAYLILASARHEALPVFSAVMVLFVMPLTLLTLVTIGVRGLRARARERERKGSPT